MSIFGAIKAIFYFFTPYAHPFERRAEKFFQWVNSYRSREEIERRLTILMQKNLLVLNVWLEKRFKNYRYLKRGNRRKLYRNAEIIASEFERFAGRVSTPEEYLRALCDFFNPRRGRFQYQEGCTFGKLLVDPRAEPMVGDCNQIVTLYAWLFSRKFPIRNLQVKLLPGHICLHYKGLDIEATNGTLKKYNSYDFIAPLSELISTNILDISDPDVATASISPESFTKAAQLAFAVSRKRGIVEHNLRAAYHNLCLASLKQNNLERGRYFAEKSGDPNLQRICDRHELFLLSQKVKGVRTLRDARPFRSAYEKLASLAHKLGDANYEKQIREILRKI